ncbi:MAG: M48 family metallopeptidase [Rhodothermales bacterium]
MRRLSIPSLFLLLALVSLPLAGCASLGLNDFNLVSLEEEWQMGEQLERDVAQQVRLSNDRTLNRYVDQLGQRIVAQTEFANLPWRFHVVEDDAINAFNVPGGLVYVHTGLIAAADNTAELAGVIAHEIAHGVERHGTERLTSAYGLNAGAAILLGQDPGLAGQIAAQIAGGGAIAKFSRDAEREADQLGVRYMARAGYNPEGMATMFQKLIADRQRSPGSVEQFFSTHPLTEDRIRDVRREARKYPTRGLTTNDGQYASIRARARR